MNGRTTEDPRYARLAARLLASPPPSDTAAPGGSPKTIDALAAALHARSQRRQLRRRLFAAGAAAALVALAVGGFTMGRHRPAPIMARGEDGTALSEGSLVEAGAAARRVTLATGTELRLAPGARLVLAELGTRQRLLLRAGRVEARVTPLVANQRFLLDTADAEVEVHGSRFEVAVVPAQAACGGTTTAVEVHEGVVTVRRADQQWRLTAGERWPSGCEPATEASRADMPRAAVPPAAVPPTRSPAPAAPARSRAASSRSEPRGRARAVAPAPPAASTLAAQNDLFANALAALRRGQVAEARAQLDQLVAHYPFGPLAETARQERAKLEAVEKAAPAGHGP
jgi:hypothetical protein